MPNKTLFTNDRVHSLENGLALVFAHVTVSSGTPTLVADKSRGVASVTDTGTGDWLFTLKDTYTELMFGAASFEVASGALNNIISETIVHTAVATGDTVQLTLWNDANGDGTLTAADPADGTVKVVLLLRVGA